MEFRFRTDGIHPQKLAGYAPDHKKYTGSIRISDLKREMLEWLDVNPREPADSYISKRIRDTLLNSPHQMQTRNNGIHVSAADAVIANNHITLDFTNKNKHGILNGGHTVMACLDGIDEANGQSIDISTANLPITVYIGFTHSKMIVIP